MEYLDKNGALGKNRTVKDIFKFKQANEEMTAHAYIKYGVGDGKMPLFTLKSSRVEYPQGGYMEVMRIFPNDKLLDILQEAVTAVNIPLKYKPFDFNKLDELIDENQPEKLVVSINQEENQGFNQEQVFQDIKNTLFNGIDASNYTAIEILTNIIKNFDGFNAKTLELFKLAQLAVTTSKATVRIVDKSELTDVNNFMEYSANNNEIKISLENLQESTEKEAIQKFMHEVVHSVTIGAYQNPITFEQRMFKDFIDESFKMYSYLGGKEGYGFTNQEEFIAEIMTNPDFQEKIKSLDRVAQSSKWWNKFVDYIRGLFGPKQVEYQQIVDEILSIIPTEQELGKGIFATKVETKQEKDIYTSLRTTEDKVKYTMERLRQSIDLNLSQYRILEKRTTDEVKKEGINKYIQVLLDLQSDMDKYKDNFQMEAILIFMKNMMTNLNYIHNKLNAIDVTDEDAITYGVKVYKNYLTTYSVVNDISDLISAIGRDTTQTVIPKADILQIEQDIIRATGTFTFLNKKIFSIMKKGMKFKLNDIKYFPQVEKKHVKRLIKEKKLSQIPGNEMEWVMDKMLGRDKDLIQEDLNVYIEELLENPMMDIANFNVNWQSSVNVSSTFVQIMNQMLTQLDNDRIAVEKQKDVEFAKAFDELVKEKGTNNITTLYENILGFDKSGKPYLKSDYKIGFYTDVHLKIREMRAEYDEKIAKKRIVIKELSRVHGPTSGEYKIGQKELSALIKEKLAKVTSFEKEHMNFNTAGELLGIKDKWRENLDGLSKAEKKVLDLFTDIISLSHKQTYGQQSLITFSYGTKFFELPKVTKSDVERFWTGNISGIVKDKIDNFTQIRPDDVGYTVRKTGLDNQQLYSLKVHYRDITGEFDNKQQSLDLMSIMRLEFKNGNMYSVRKKAEMDLTFLLDIAKDKDYYEKTGTTKIVNWRDHKLNIVSGRETNTVKVMTNMLESRFYDMMSHTDTKLGNADMNKVVGAINRFSAFFTLTFNIASGTANVVNANAQLFLESFLMGQHIKASSIAKANLMYSKHLVNSISDISNPINTSFVNQLNELFNVRGIFNLSNANFLQSDMIKAGLDSKSLQVFQESGEHWMQSVITMSVLDGVKVMNENGKFINIDGKVVEESDAASLLDMITVDKTTGLITTSDKVVYTTHSRLTKYNEGGKEKVDLLIIKKIYDSMGNYRETDQPEIMRHWWGKLIMLYRKYLVPMGVARGKGIMYSLKKQEDLDEDEKSFSYALQEDEEGTYTTLVRFLMNNIRNKQFAMSAMEWNKLSEYEKHNIKRSVTEIVLTSALLPLMSMFFSGLAGGDDDSYLYFLAYQIRRLETELSQYRNPSEAYKILRSPIPSARILETAATIVGGVFHPATYTEKYERGRWKDENKWKIKVQKQIPIVKEIMRDYQSLYNYQDNLFGAGL
jgi:hypothetical protein